MKTKLLLIYGYLLPPITSVAASSLPYFFNYDYKNISDYFSQNFSLLLALFAAIGALVIPFQSSIITEDNPHILEVLSKTKVREVYLHASVFQTVLILMMFLLLLFLSANKVQTSLTGYIQLLASAMITFESIALISNGRSYGNIREQIYL